MARRSPSFIGGLFVLAADEFVGLATRAGHVEDLTELCEARNRVERAVVEHGWDGDWFRRAYDYGGAPVGSNQNEEGQIYVEPQGMCVMAGIGLEDGKAERALHSVARQLTTPHGIMLLQPAYSRYYAELGEISSYPPGYKENASVFCHTNPWITIANVRAARADRAFETYLLINPSAREDQSEVHRCEPYVYSQTIAGRDAASHGEARNSWLTGTAAWSFVAITQWILGIRPEYDGLRVEPCLPSHWDGFQATRRFRGAIYSIVVRSTTEVTQKRIEVVVDGRQIDGTVVPLAPAGTSVRVEVTLS